MTKVDKFRYKGFVGTIVEDDEAVFKGEVIGLKTNNAYTARTIEELEQQFKCKVESFLESCHILGVEPNIAGSDKLIKWPYFFILTFGVLIVFIIWFNYPIKMPQNNATPTEYNTILVNWLDKSSSYFNNFTAPLLSFLSFIALLYTIYRQNASYRISLKELALTREELFLTRREFEKSTIANQEQASALKQQVEGSKLAASKQELLLSQQKKSANLQIFETSFYALLSEHNKALDKLVESEFIKNIKDKNCISIEDFRAELIGNITVCRYFRILYQLLKFITKTHPSNKDKLFTEYHLKTNVEDEEKSYSSLVRSMLPTDIIFALGVNCYVGVNHDNDYRKYFLLLARYSFLEHLNVSDHIVYNKYDRNTDDPNDYLPNAYEIIIKTYSPLCFGSNESVKVPRNLFKEIFESKNIEENIPVHLVNYFKRDFCKESLHHAMLREHGEKTESFQETALDNWPI